VPVRWIHGMRYRERWGLAHWRLRRYREVTTTHRLTARCIVPTGLSAFGGSRSWTGQCAMHRPGHPGHESFRQSGWMAITCCAWCHGPCNSLRERGPSARVGYARARPSTMITHSAGAD